MLTLVSESSLAAFFLAAFLSDLLCMPLGIFFTLALVLVVGASAYFTLLLQAYLDERFVVSRVDIFANASESESLRMMIALLRLVELAAFRPREEFVLRGFVERHIEICESQMCNCIEYYKVIGSTYRLQLATVASMKEEDHATKMSQ
jgi:hypothetical protein